MDWLWIALGLLSLLVVSFLVFGRSKTQLPEQVQEPTKTSEAQLPSPQETLTSEALSSGSPLPAPLEPVAVDLDARETASRSRGRLETVSAEMLGQGVQTPPPPPEVPVLSQPSAKERQAEERQESALAMRRGLRSTRSGFFGKLVQLFSGAKAFEESDLDDAMDLLVMGDVGARTAEKYVEELRARSKRGELSKELSALEALKSLAKETLGENKGPIVLNHTPTVVLIVGVNGVGKTTTIGKLASRYAREGKKVLLAAGDTFRAAAVEQLEVWAGRAGCEIHKGNDKADPASVIFEAVKRAQNEGFDLVLADTAGRLHNKANLMEELKKVARTVEKACGRSADEVFLVLDATTGQNAIQQAQIFQEAASLTGLVLTKLDGTAKGGVVLGIVDTQNLPVRYIGVGEKIDDLRVFDSELFLEALFDRGEEDVAA